MSIKNCFTSKNIVLFLIVTVGITYYLSNSQNNSLVQYFPLLIILLCPLIHLFMHGGIIINIKKRKIMIKNNHLMK